MKTKRLVFYACCILIFFAVTSSFGQTKFSVDTGGSIQDIVKSLEGPNVEIFKESVRVTGSFDPGAAGTFNDVLGLLDVQQGLIMTSGHAKLAIGPNNASNTGYPTKITSNASNQSFDPDLESVVPGEQLYDLISIEFDIRVTNTVLSFNYIFGSEEYPEYERQYNDVFGFFISRPGFEGVKNLAVTENGIPVSVKSINSSKNTQYFISNGDGSNPAKNFYMQYDGFTKKLTAKTEVIPCQIYHIKLAIADARDNILDSGVLIEKGSFTSTSKLDIDLRFEHEEYQYAVESCNKGYFVIKKDLDWLDIEDPVTLEFMLSGLATNGDDYAFIGGTTITIPANEESVEMEINALFDAINEQDGENVHLDIILTCGGGIIATASADMIIKDKIDYPINSIVCKDVLMPINTNAPDQYEFTWVANPALSCTDCPSPSVNLSADANFPVHVKDLVSGCETDTEAAVSIYTINAYFKYFRDVNYLSSDAFFDNLSTGAETYNWDFGDGGTSTAFEPTHSYKSGETLDPVTYKITLNVSALQGQCTSEYDTTITLEPFYIPNVITPNNDAWNQYFTVKGIANGIWKIRIYNRWETLVFRSDGYNNNWEGEGVASGVYYFRLTNPHGDREYKGWIHVIK